MLPEGADIEGEGVEVCWYLKMLVCVHKGAGVDRVVLRFVVT